MRRTSSSSSNSAAAPAGLTLPACPNSTLTYPVTPDCPAEPVAPGIIVWPESPAPFQDKDPRFLNALRTLALSMDAPVIAGTTSYDRNGARFDMYNSAIFVGPDGSVVDRYDKIHLVPWGEYIPYKRFFSFAKNLTQQAGDMTHGWRRVVFATDGHRFGVFICYEEIFGDEIRLFVKQGAQVLVNISNDGWYGDTCAPWQTLNMSACALSKIGAGYCVTPTPASPPSSTLTGGLRLVWSATR